MNGEFINLDTAKKYKKIKIWTNDGAKKLIVYHIHNIIFLTGKQVKICIEKKNMV